MGKKRITVKLQSAILLLILIAGVALAELKLVGELLLNNIEDVVVRDVVVKENLAYIALGRAGFAIYDLTNPASPIQVALCDIPDFAIAIAVSGNYVYVIDSRLGLRIIDITQPSAPQEVGVWRKSRALKFARVKIKDNHAYILEADFEMNQWHTIVKNIRRLHILDIGVLSSPRRVKVLQMSDHGLSFDTGAMVIEENYGYVSDPNAGLRIIDISNPSLAREVALYTGNPAPSEPIGVAIKGNYVYLVWRSPYCLTVIDISNPSTPRKVSSLELPSCPTGVDISGNYVYITHFSELRVVDITNPFALKEVACVDVPAKKVTVSGDYIYVSHFGSDGGLRIFSLFSSSITFKQASKLPEVLNISPNPVLEEARFIVTQDITPGVVKIYNILGQLIRAFPINHSFRHSNNLIVWEGESDWGSKVGAGVYFGSIETHSQRSSQRMLILR
jgi:hypothetical protein